MKKTALILVVTAVLIGCHHQASPPETMTSWNSPPADPDYVAMLDELATVVRQAEADPQAKDSKQKAAAVAQAAKQVFAARQITDCREDTRPRVKGARCRDGVFHVFGHNYFWDFKPVVEDGRVTEVVILGMSPICAN